MNEMTEEEWKQVHKEMATVNPCGSQCRHPFDCFEKRRCGWPLDAPYSQIPITPRETTEGA